MRIRPQASAIGTVRALCAIWAARPLLLLAAPAWPQPADADIGRAPTEPFSRLGFGLLQVTFSEAVTRAASISPSLRAKRAQLVAPNGEHKYDNALLVSSPGTRPDVESRFACWADRQRQRGSRAGGSRALAASPDCSSEDSTPCLSSGAYRILHSCLNEAERPLPPIRVTPHPCFNECKGSHRGRRLRRTDQQRSLPAASN